MTQQAHHAIRAAKNIRNWGSYAANRYRKKRGVPIGLYLIAVECEAFEYLYKQR